MRVNITRVIFSSITLPVQRPRFKQVWSLLIESLQHKTLLQWKAFANQGVFVVPNYNKQGKMPAENKFAEFGEGNFNWRLSLFQFSGYRCPLSSWLLCVIIVTLLTQCLPRVLRKQSCYIGTGDYPHHSNPHWNHEGNRRYIHAYFIGCYATTSRGSCQSKRHDKFHT